jgi:hypothetical protein
MASKQSPPGSHANSTRFGSLGTAAGKTLASADRLRNSVQTPFRNRSAELAPDVRGLPSAVVSGKTAKLSGGTGNGHVDRCTDAPEGRVWCDCYFMRWVYTSSPRNPRGVVDETRFRYADHCEIQSIYHACWLAKAQMSLSLAGCAREAKEDSASPVHGYRRGIGL